MWLVAPININVQETPKERASSFGKKRMFGNISVIFLAIQKFAIYSQMWYNTGIIKQENIENECID